MPPVFGPLSPSPTRLKSWAGCSGRAVRPSVIAAVKAYTTVGEICGAVKQVFGTYQEPVRF